MSLYSKNLLHILENHDLRCVEWDVKPYYTIPFRKSPARKKSDYNKNAI